MPDDRGEAQAGGRFPGRAPIDAYGNGGFRFADMSHRGAILCLPASIEAWKAAPDDASILLPAHLSRVVAERAHVDFLILGSGATLVLPPAEVGAFLAARGIGLDVMDTGAACRTYNILLGERRRVAAALLAVT